MFGQMKKMGQMRLFLLFLLIYSSESARCINSIHAQCGSNFQAYNSTFYPNLLGEWSAEESNESFAKFYPLKMMQCSKYINLFLCSVLSPACVDENLSGTLPFLIPVPPCRELCEKSLSDCASILEEFDIFLPPQFHCLNFPRENDGHSCIPLQSESLPLPDGTLSWNNDDSSSLVEHQPQCPTTQRAKYSSWSFMDLPSCSQPCEPMNKSEKETKLIRIVSGRRCFFAMCYLVISLICVVGLVSPESIVCSEREVNEDQTIVQGTGLIQGSTHRPCTIMFMLFFYFSMAALCWWFSLTMSWGLSSVFQWSSEAIATSSTLLHVFGWGLPALFTMVGVSKHEIQGDPFLEICVLSNSDFSRWTMTFLPLAFCSIFGTLAFAIGLCALRKVKDTIKIDKNSNKKLQIFVLRLTVFSLSILIPSFIQLLLKFYEADHQRSWEKKFYEDNCMELIVPCPMEKSEIEPASTGLIIFKYFVVLAPGLAPLVWIANSKTIKNWSWKSDNSTTTSSSCIKSNLIEEKSSLAGDSRAESFEPVQPVTSSPQPDSRFVYV
ncbi:Oidioi.mRNA.OKI2018_I69.chr1.g1255.t1.cds [Oikopleura dioica]|uniref:Oidioi.mRNA.OKI2018_I69.chr1.g1255.t1.cds n=1 Tax=Oikopleura dioica TaxID=34765 RepID=A0ABN7SMD0_OIKDI|nr:Oidioi.mRNA.OKI2018_I69.chr1.g1255.t1.cds [Oikopleura dioica]